MAALLHRFHIGGQKTTRGNAMVHPSSIGAHLMAQLPLKGSLCCKSFLTRLLLLCFAGFRLLEWTCFSSEGDAVFEERCVQKYLSQTAEAAECVKFGTQPLKSSH